MRVLVAVAALALLAPAVFASTPSTHPDGLDPDFDYVCHLVGGSTHSNYENGDPTDGCPDRPLLPGQTIAFHNDFQNVLPNCAAVEDSVGNVVHTALLMSGQVTSGSESWTVPNKGERASGETPPYVINWYQAFCPGPVPPGPPLIKDGPFLESADYLCTRSGTVGTDGCPESASSSGVYEFAVDDMVAFYNDLGTYAAVQAVGPGGAPQYYTWCLAPGEWTEFSDSWRVTPPLGVQGTLAWYENCDTSFPWERGHEYVVF